METKNVKITIWCNILCCNVQPKSGATTLSCQFAKCQEMVKQWNSGSMQSLNVAGLKTGVYTISVIDDKGKLYSQQFIKQ